MLYRENVTNCFCTALLSCCHSPCKYSWPLPCMLGFKLQALRAKTVSSPKVRKTESPEDKKNASLRGTKQSLRMLINLYCWTFINFLYSIEIASYLAMTRSVILSPSPLERGWGEVCLISNRLSYPPGVPTGQTVRWSVVPVSWRLHVATGFLLVLFWQFLPRSRNQCAG